jgi:chorismate mutase
MHERQMMVRGIRGAITVPVNTENAILSATARLLREMVMRNEVSPDSIASAFFSVTPDLHAQFPASAARSMGWNEVPVLHVVEMDVPGALDHCVRVLLHVNTTLKQSEIAHVYLDGARNLRPDLAQAR